MNNFFKTLIMFLLTSSCIVSESPIPKNSNILCYNKMQSIVIPIYNFKWDREKQCTALHSTAILIGSDNDSIEFALLTAKHCIENKDSICFGWLHPENPQFPNIACYSVIPGNNYRRLDNDSIDAAVFIIYKEARFGLPGWVKDIRDINVDNNIIFIHRNKVLEKNSFYYDYPIGGNIVTFGYPIGLGAKTIGLNKPVLITGNIAFDEIINYIEGPVLLGDYYSLGGLSGGPVFLITEEMSGKGVVYSFHFIGLNVGHVAIQSTSNTGLSLVVSTKILRELLYKADVWERENE